MLNFFRKKKTKVTIDKLALLITGMEHSGTTFLGNILNDKLINAKGAFECGLLLAKSPEDFVNLKPFHFWMTLADRQGSNLDSWSFLDI